MDFAVASMMELLYRTLENELGAFYILFPSIYFPVYYRLIKMYVNLRSQSFLNWFNLVDCSQVILDIFHYSDVIMSPVVSQINGVSIVYSTVCSGADQRKHQSSASLVFVMGIHRWAVNSPHKGPVTRKLFPFDDVIVCWSTDSTWLCNIYGSLTTTVTWFCVWWL